MKKSMRLQYEEFSINKMPKHLEDLIQHIKRVANHSISVIHILPHA